MLQFSRKMPDWKAWLKDVYDNIARSVLQAPKVYFYDTGLVEGKLSDEKPHRTLQRFALEKAPAQAVQVVRNARHSYTLGDIQIAAAAAYLNGLAA